MKNVVELRQELASILYDLRHRKIKVDEADALSNIAGKMLASAKLELEYFTALKQNPNIPFLTQGDELLIENPPLKVKGIKP